MAVNLFDYYRRTQRDFTTQAERSSDLAVKLRDRSYADANEKIVNIQNDVFRKVSGDPNLNFGGDNPGIVSLDVMLQAYTPEIYKNAGNKITKDGLEGIIDQVNSMGLVQYATGNATFITGIEEAEPNADGEIQYRLDLGEIESGKTGPNVRFRSLSPTDLDEKGDLVVTAKQLGNIFEDYQYNVRRKTSPIFGTEIAYDYLSDPQGTGNPIVTKKQIAEGQTGGPNGTNYGGDSGDSNLDNKAYTGDVEFTGNVFQYLEEQGLNPTSEVKTLFEGGADEVVQLTDSQIQALENEYGIPMKNANLTFARNQILELRARKKAAQADLDDPDQNLSETERRKRELIIKSAEQREKRIMGDADQFLKGGINVQLQAALDRDAEEDLKAEKKINQDPQLTRFRRQLAEQQKLYNNAEEGEFKKQTGERIAKLETQINEREADIDPRIVTDVRKGKINQKIAKILESPDTYFQPVESIAKLLEEADYELSEETRAGLDEYINANLVSRTDGGAIVKLTSDVRTDNNGNQTNATGLGSQSNAQTRSKIDNRAFSILLSLEANGKLSGDQILTLMETMRYTGTLDTKMLNAMIEEKKNLSAEVLKRKNDVLDNFNSLVDKENGINAQIARFEAHRASGDAGNLQDFVTHYNAIYRDLSVFEILNSVNPATGQIDPKFRGAAVILDQLNVGMLGAIAIESNDENFIEWLTSAGKATEGEAFDPFDPSGLRIKAIYADDATYTYEQLFNERGQRKQDQPPVKAFQLVTLDGRPVGGEITRENLASTLDKLEAPGRNPQFIMSRFEQQSFLSR